MITLALAAEDEAGEWVVHRVTDMHLLAIDWIDREVLDSVRAWQAFQGRGWLPLRKVRDLARQRIGNHFKLCGGFDGVPGAADALMLRMLFTCLAMDEPRPDIVVVARDIDTTDRRSGFQQAVADREWPFEIVGALAQPETEAWLVAAWNAESDPERERHARLRAECGFDPVAHSHRLTSTAKTRRDAKVVLAELTCTGRTGRARFASKSGAELRACGQDNGLAEFVEHHEKALARQLHLRGHTA